MRISELIRQPAGTTHYYETDSPHARQSRAQQIALAARRAGGRLTTESIDAFRRSGEPVRLLRVEVVEPGSPPGKRGPKGR